jgi:hypothetical protein
MLQLDIEQVERLLLVQIKKYIQLQQWYINQAENEVVTWFSLKMDAFNHLRLATHIKREDSQGAR